MSTQQVDLTCSFHPEVRLDHRKTLVDRFDVSIRASSNPYYIFITSLTTKRPEDLQIEKVKTLFCLVELILFERVQEERGIQQVEKVHIKLDTISPHPLSLLGLRLGRLAQHLYHLFLQIALESAIPSSSDPPSLSRSVPHSFSIPRSSAGTTPTRGYEEFDLPGIYVNNLLGLMALLLSYPIRDFPTSLHRSVPKPIFSSGEGDLGGRG